MRLDQFDPADAEAQLPSELERLKAQNAELRAENDRLRAMLSGMP